MSSRIGAQTQDFREGGGVLGHSSIVAAAGEAEAGGFIVPGRAGVRRGSRAEKAASKKGHLFWDSEGWIGVHNRPP